MKFRAEERAFMLDCARKYYTPGWIKRLIPELEAAKMNALYLHFSEDMGLRIESKQYPWLAGGDHSLCVWGKENGLAEDDGKFLTQDEVADIVAFARDHGVEIIPSFDSPGHMNYAVKRYNAHFGTDIGNYFHKNGRISIVHGSSVKKEPEQLNFSRGIDISNPEAVRFAKSLYEEYGRFFRSLGCTKFDIGGDELLGFGETIDDSFSKWNQLDHWQALAKEKTGNEDAVAYDAFLLYMNDIYAQMKSLGYTSVRMWNDDAYRNLDTGWKRAVELNKNIEIQFWQPAANGDTNTVFTYLDEGHNVYNFTAYYTYYVLGFGFRFRKNISHEDVDREWDISLFDQRHPENNLTAPHPQVKGGGFCLWSDTPAAETEEEILAHLKPYITVCGKKLYEM